MKNSSQLPIFQTVGEAKIIYKTTCLPFHHIKSSVDASMFLQEIWDKDSIEYFESFVVLGLNRKNEITSYNFVSHGGIAGTVADPKMIFQFALLNNASAIILAHNHPSGNLKPSEQDKRLTDKVKTAGQCMDMPVLDHLIITKDGYFSFADEGLM